MLQSLHDLRYHQRHLLSIFVLANKVWQSPQLAEVKEADRLVNSKLCFILAFLPYQSLSKKEHNEGSETPWLMDVL